MPKVKKFELASGSTSTCKNLSPTDQLIFLIDPITLVAPILPICTENKPPMLVLVALTSEYKTDPVAELFLILKRIVKLRFGKILPAASRATP